MIKDNSLKIRAKILTVVSMIQATSTILTLALKMGLNAKSISLCTGAFKQPG